jgi:putative membrane protein insertion efficiency factor
MLKQILRFFIRAYQIVTVNTAPTCRYFPSCSHYALQAIDKHGAAKGSFLAIWRILRCNPFSEGGVDPVP